jgi:MFS family permease
MVYRWYEPKTVSEFDPAFDVLCTGLIISFYLFLQLNMQAVFLMCSKNFSERQIGVLFLAFGLSQFVCMTPAGYFLDYSNHKIDWVIWSGIMTSLLTVTTALTAQDGGENMGLMILLKIIQGGASAILPPAFNSISLGIVGSTGFTLQVSKNRTMNHIGTALIVALGSLIAYFLFPNIGLLFIVGPLTMIGLYYNMNRIKPNHIDRDAARALIIESPTMTEYEHLETQSQIAGMSYDGGELGSSSESSRSERSYNPPNASLGGGYVPVGTSSSSESSREGRTYDPPGALLKGNISRDATDKHNITKAQEMVQLNKSNSTPHQPTPNENSERSFPSFRLGWGVDQNHDQSQTPRTPLAVLKDPTLVLFTLVVFCFHMANSSVLPLVMQSLAVEDEKNGILLSGTCIFVGQAFMSWFARICGLYSPKWGRKGLIVVALSSLTIRCFSLTVLMTANAQAVTPIESVIIKTLIVSTQLLDSVGAGIFGTMHILVTNDISSRSGRFSLMMGITSSAMCLGATVSGYIGQAIAQDYGYAMAFTWLGGMSLVPLLLYVFLMPETLPDYVRPESRKRRLAAIFKKLNEQRRKIFRRRKKKQRKRAIRLKLDDGEKQEGLVDNSETTGYPTTEFV